MGKKKGAEELREDAEVVGATIAACVLVASNENGSGSLNMLVSCILMNTRDYDEFPRMVMDHVLNLLDPSRDGRYLRIGAGNRLIERARDSRVKAMALMEQNKIMLRSRADKESLKEPLTQMVNLASEMDAMEAAANALLDESRQLLQKAVEATVRPQMMAGMVVAPMEKCQCASCTQKEGKDEVTH